MTTPTVHETPITREGSRIMPDPTYSTDHEREAYHMGVAAAEAAASWAADGNTSDETRRAVLAMLADGDPAAYDYLPARPNLSGEWADAPTPASLARDIGAIDIARHWPGYDLDDPADTEIIAEDEIVAAIADAWEAGVADTFEDACVRELRAAG